MPWVWPKKKMAGDLNRHFFKDNIQVAKWFMKRRSTSLSVKVMQIKPLMRYPLTPVKLIINKNNNKKITSVSEDVEKLELCILRVGMWASHCGKQYVGSSEYCR